MKHALSGPADFVLDMSTAHVFTVSGLPTEISHAFQCPVDARAEVVFLLSFSTSGANAKLNISDIVVKGAHSDPGAGWDTVVALEMLNPKQHYFYIIPATAHLSAIAVKIRPTFEWNQVTLSLMNKDGLITGISGTVYMHNYDNNSLEKECADSDDILVPRFWRPSCEFAINSQKMD